MLKAARQLKSEEIDRQTVIARLPALKHEGFVEVRESLIAAARPSPQRKHTPEIPPLPASSNDARYSVQALFWSDKRIH